MYPRIDFSLALNIAPTLKGVYRGIPLGNEKGIISKSFKLKKSILRTQYL